MKLGSSDPFDPAYVDGSRIPLRQTLDIFRTVQGKIMTIVDASTDDLVKRKAMNDLVREAFKGQLEYVNNLVHHGEIIEESHKG